MLEAEKQPLRSKPLVDLAAFKGKNDGCCSKRGALKMRVFVIPCLAVCLASASPSTAASLRLCKDQVAQDRGLYVQVFPPHSLGCWSQVQNHYPVYEGSTTASNLPTLPPDNRSGVAKFAYLIQQPETSETVVLVKERVMTLQLDKNSGQYLPQQAANPPNDVILVRPRVLSNRCGERPQDYGPVPGTRKGVMNVGDYNRYHEQGLTFGFIKNAIPRSDQLRDFHFRYPISTPESKAGCRDTDDYATGNRLEYAFKGLSDTSGSSTLSFVAHAIVSSAYAANKFYSKLKVQNLYVGARGSKPDQPSATRYSVVPFNVDADAYTRTEITISNLESYRDGAHWPSTWQVDWMARNPATRN